MSYHPIIGISIFILAIFIAFFLGRFLLKKSITASLFGKSLIHKKGGVPKGEITSPDAPWLKTKSKN